MFIVRVFYVLFFYRSDYAQHMAALYYADENSNSDGHDDQPVSCHCYKGSSGVVIQIDGRADEMFNRAFPQVTPTPQVVNCVY